MKDNTLKNVWAVCENWPTSTRCELVVYMRQSSPQWMAIWQRTHIIRGSSSSLSFAELALFKHNGRRAQRELHRRQQSTTFNKMPFTRHDCNLQARLQCSCYKTYGVISNSLIRSHSLISAACSCERCECIWYGPIPFTFIEFRNVEVFLNCSFSGNEISLYLLPQGCQQRPKGSRRTHFVTDSNKVPH